jgi:catechol 2,3-dioxygenase-like lactoylglutathione lyase family enzyme
MKLNVNHITIGSDNARELASFYLNVVGLQPTITPGAKNVDPNSYKWLKLGDKELHIVERDKSIAERLGVNIDPMNPHLAIDVETVEELHDLRDRLVKSGVKWMDWSPHGIPGKHQIFIVDPGGNLIEFLLKGTAP